MFALIITIISIAMVTALSAATLYYMSTVTFSQTVKVDASVFISGAEQIAAAFVLHNLNGVDSTPTLDSLLPDYLTIVPNYKGAEYTFHSTYKNYLTTNVSKDVCLELNSRNGITDETPDITQYTYSCLMSDDIEQPLAFYKVMDNH